MKKLICILAGAALLGACEQKTEVVTPATSPAPDAALTGARPKKSTTTTTTNTLTAATTPAVSTETKTESTESTTVTGSTPSP